MLYYDRIDVSEGTDTNKTSASKECDICHYWYFLNFSFKFQPSLCNRCHDLLMMSINLSDIKCKTYKTLVLFEILKVLIVAVLLG